MWPKLRRVLEIEAFVLLIVCFLGALLFDYRIATKRERAHAIMCAENLLRSASGEFAAYLFSAQGAAAYSATILKSAIEHGENDENLTIFDMSLFDKILTKPMTGEKIRLALDEIPRVSRRS